MCEYGDLTEQQLLLFAKRPSALSKINISLILIIMERLDLYLAVDQIGYSMPLNPKLPTKYIGIFYIHFVISTNCKQTSSLLKKNINVFPVYKHFKTLF